MRIIIICILISVYQISICQTIITLQPDSAKYVINKNIYGHFAEHLGNSIYGGFYVGEKSSIPNTAGIRNDVIAALRDLKIPNLRWPGGCFADTYHWKDGIGPLKLRPSIINTNWGGTKEDNSFGTNNFLNMCEILGAEPYISGNVGSGSVQELADWVQYTNFSDGPMAKLRKEYGRSVPWNVKFWGIGNEAWGCGGNMTPEYYANEFRKYASFMNSSPAANLIKIASGANSEDYNWTEVLMKNIPISMLGGLALHHYSVIDWNKKGAAAEFSELEYSISLKRALKMEELITRHSAIMDKYDPAKNVALVVDEWGGWYNVEPGTNPGFLFQQNTMRDAMIAGVTLNIFNNHCDRVKMANLAQTINVLQSVILTHNESMILTPTYFVMQMYNVHQNADLIPSEITNMPYYKNGETSLPSISVSSSRKKDGSINISIVNIDASNSQTVEINGIKNAHSVTGKILSSDHLQDHNSFTNAKKIATKIFTNIKIQNNSIHIVIPAFSVIALHVN